MNETIWFRTKAKPAINKAVPGCIILKNDPNQNQGIPDYTIFFGKKYAILEAKKNATASHRPNQDWYISEKFGNEFGTYTSFVYPENLEQVISELVEWFGC